MAIHLGRRTTPVRQIVAVVAGLCVALAIMFWQDAWTDPSEFLQLGISGLRDRAQYAAVGWDNRKDPRLEDVERDALNLEEVFGKRFFQVSLVNYAQTGSADLVQRSVSYAGTRTRLRQVLRKVLRGEPIRIGYLGGSSQSSRSLLPLRTRSDLLQSRPVQALGAWHHRSISGLAKCSACSTRPFPTQRTRSMERE